MTGDDRPLSTDGLGMEAVDDSRAFHGLPPDPSVLMDGHAREPSRAQSGSVEEVRSPLTSKNRPLRGFLDDAITPPGRPFMVYADASDRRTTAGLWLPDVLRPIARDVADLSAPTVLEPEAR